jgi:hypothetical protein
MDASEIKQVECGLLLCQRSFTVDIAQHMNHLGHFENVVLESGIIDLEFSDDEFLVFDELQCFFQFDCMVVAVCVLRFQPFLVSIGFGVGREIGSSVEYVVVTGAAKTLGFIIERGYLVDIGTVVSDTGRIIVRIGDERHCFRIDYVV